MMDIRKVPISKVVPWEKNPRGIKTLDYERLKRIGFNAAIVEIKVKRLVSQDKSLRLTLEVDQPEDKLVATLNELFKADADVGVAIAETEKK